jgi:DNA-binding response OmpR family regulator
MSFIKQNHISVRDKLLVIDDDYATRLLIKKILSDTKIIIIETGCGREAFDLFSNFSKEIFLVILDILLPFYDGLTLIQKFREVDPWVPVIALSAISPQELAIKCKLAGFSQYLSKPFRVRELRQIINSYYSYSIKNIDT